MLSTVILSVLAGVAVALEGKCYDPSPAFPVPLWKKPGPELPKSAFATLEKLVTTEIGADFNTSSFSIEVTSNTDTLWTYYRSASVHDKDRPGVVDIDGESQYRIASITKTFTVLAVLYQHAAGNLSLDDSIVESIPELAHDPTGDLPFKDITLRSLASQLSGLPRDFAFGEMLPGFPDPTSVGLPPVTHDGMPPCYRESSCDKADLLKHLKTFKPLFAPNQKSTYSNLAFDLLGLAIETTSGMNYSDYITQSILQPLNMTFASLDKPSDKRAVLPVGYNYWDAEEGVQRPTGGIYASSSDMSKYVRYVLTHYNALATGVNWFMPASSSTGMNSFYGMPWEIARSDKILLQSKRPVTFVTKSGAVPAYFSKIIMLPEYGLGITILVGGESPLLAKLAELVSVSLTRSAETTIWSSIDKTYTGLYTATNSSLNSSITLTSSPAHGLVLTSFISNSTDVFKDLFPLLMPTLLGGNDVPWRAQLVPTLLYKNETMQQGEIWRILIAANREQPDESGSVWDDFCFTNEEYATYGGLPLNEVVFWHEEDVVELPAWRLSLKAKDVSAGDRAIVDQAHEYL